jgi:peptide/nickel transport system permease protein
MAKASWASSSLTRKAGICLILGLLLLALLSPWLTPYDPKLVGVPYQPPSSHHLLGTNDMGQDIFSQLLVASRVSLAVGLLSALLSVSLGLLVGMVAGYRRGWTEELLMGSTDLLLILPGLPLMIILAAYLGPSIWNIVLVIGLLWWCPTARIIHARTLQLRGAPFVDSARALGYGRGYIMGRHIMPNLRDVLATRFIMAVATGMLAEASLNFLGLGDPFQLSWGGMVNAAFNRGGFVNDMWYWYVPPALMIALSIISFMLVISWKEERTVLEGMA